MLKCVFWLHLPILASTLIPFSQFVALARELGLQITLEQAREAIASIDADGSSAYIPHIQQM